MYRYVSLERWADLRATRRRGADLSAGGSGGRPERDDGPRPRQPPQLGQAAFPEPQQRDAWAGRGRGAAALAAGEVTTPDLAELEALTRPEDQIAWLGDYLVRALAKLIASANAGVLDKVEVDALTSLMRLLEPAKILAVAPENEKGNQIDDDADVCGLVFGGTAGLKIATELGIARTIGSIELMLMGSAVASLCAWWAMGFLARAFERGGWVWSKERRESDER